MTPEQRQDFDDMHAHGVRDGEEIRLLVELPGFALTYSMVQTWLPAAAAQP